MKKQQDMMMMRKPQHRANAKYFFLKLLIKLNSILLMKETREKNVKLIDVIEISKIYVKQLLLPIIL